jgi:hypothetical protein
MVAQGRGGAIVNIGSMWAHQAIAATPSSGYSAAKGALHTFTRNLVIELAPHDIRVNAVAPAVVATAIYERFVPWDKIEETLHSFDCFHPLGWVGIARDLANTITFLLSRRPAGSPAPSGTSTAVSWPDETNHPLQPACAPTQPPGAWAGTVDPTVFPPDNAGQTVMPRTGGSAPGLVNDQNRY